LFFVSFFVPLPGQNPFQAGQSPRQSPLGFVQKIPFSLGVIQFTVAATISFIYIKRSNLLKVSSSSMMMQMQQQQQPQLR
jgi:hypothetical protein